MVGFGFTIGCGDCWLLSVYVDLCCVAVLVFGSVFAFLWWFVGLIWWFSAYLGVLLQFG